MNLLGLDLQKVADGVFYERGSSIKTKNKLETRLEKLYYHRNIIAHQSGRRHYDAIREEITKDMVKEHIEDIKRIVAQIQELARQKA